MVMFTRSMKKTKHIAKKKKEKLLPPIRVRLSDKKIISKSDGPQKKVSSIHFNLFFFISYSTNIIFLFSLKKTNISMTTGPIVNLCSDDVQIEEKDDEYDNNR